MYSKYTDRCIQYVTLYFDKKVAKNIEHNFFQVEIGIQIQLSAARYTQYPLKMNICKDNIYERYRIM